jgi:deoxyhypusine synthase
MLPSDIIIQQTQQQQELNAAIQQINTMASLLDENADKTANEQALLDAGVPPLAAAAVMATNEEMPEGSATCSGYDFNQGVDFSKLMASYATHGFQASNMGLAINEINRMRNWRLSDEPVKEDDDEEWKDPEVRKNTKATIFFGYTSNMISCGNREVIRYLCQHKMVDLIVTTGGGIEEDFMKCFSPHYMGDFALKGAGLRKKGLNRIGNLIVPNSNYCHFEDWMTPLLDTMLEEQKTKGTVWSPSKMINRMGKEINNPESVYYWCWKNDIPVMCPALTDGSVGDMLYFHSYKNPGLVLDIAQDIRIINDKALRAKKTGMLILGGGIVKHHICNANLMRNGADFSVFVNTGQEFDGSDSGAKPDEAISWGKIKMDAKPVKLCCDASLALPLLVSQTFAKDFKPEA